jgi:hypothetical protein
MLLPPPKKSRPREVPFDVPPTVDARRIIPLPKQSRQQRRKRRLDPDDLLPAEAAAAAVLDGGVRLGYALETLARLPLAEAFYDLWAFVANDALLESLFDRHRGRCYLDKLAFSDLVAVLGDALTRHHGSGRRAIITAMQSQQLPTQARTVYGKLARLPLPLSEAFLSELTGRLQPLFPAGLYRSDLPDCLAGLAVVVLDGKKIKKVAKRLLATRGQPGKLYGGKVLAAYLPADGLVVALAADPDGEANDIRLMPRVMPLARQAVKGPRLWVADAQFCDLDQPALFTQAEGDHFLLRFTLRNGFEADPERPAQRGVNASGQTFVEEWGWMGSAKDKRRRYVRRISLERPGEETVVLVTDLLDAEKYPAVDLLLIYLMRWQIENVFQQITEVFDLRRLIGSTPAATVFQASLCLVIYNLLQVIRGYIAQGRPEPTKVDDLSSEMIFRDLHEELVSLHKTLTEEELSALLCRCPSDTEVRTRLTDRLGHVWSVLWLKARNKKPRPHKDKSKKSGAHSSVHKVLQKAKEKKKKKTPESG